MSFAWVILSTYAVAYHQQGTKCIRFNHIPGHKVQQTQFGPYGGMTVRVNVADEWKTVEESLMHAVVPSVHIRLQVGGARLYMGYGL